jgi:hypothetical protein
MPRRLLIREAEEVWRRGIERATQVCAIQDGAEWIKDGCRTAIATMRCASSTRAHAAGYLSEIADKVRDGGGHLPPKWVDGVLHRLKHEGPTRVLLHVSRLARHYPPIQEQVNYLQKRRELMDYPTRPSAGLADWVWKCGKRSQVGDASAPLQGQACIGDPSTSIPCLPCVWHCSMVAGRSPGRSNCACASNSASWSVGRVTSLAFLSNRPHGRGPVSLGATHLFPPYAQASGRRKKMKRTPGQVWS